MSPTKPLDPANQRNRQRRLRSQRLQQTRAANTLPSEETPMSKAAVKKCQEQEQQREAAAKFEAAGKPQSLAAQEPVELTVEPAAPAITTPALSVAEVERRIREAEQRLTDKLAAIEEEHKAELVQLAMARAEAETEEHERKVIDVRATLEAAVARLKGPVRDPEAEDLEARRAKHDLRVAPYLAEMKQVERTLAAFDERYGAQLAALEAVPREQWLVGQPAGKSAPQSVALVQALMQTVERLQLLPRDMRQNITGWRQELRHLREWAGVPHAAFGGGVPEYEAAMGQLLGTGATTGINRGNIRAHLASVETLDAQLALIAQQIAAVQARQQVGGASIFEFEPRRHVVEEQLGAMRQRAFAETHGQPHRYTDEAPSLFVKN